MAEIVLRQGGSVRTDLRSNRSYTIEVTGLEVGVPAVVLITGPDTTFKVRVPGELITSPNLSRPFSTGPLFESGGNYVASVYQREAMICPKAVWPMTA